MSNRAVLKNLRIYGENGSKFCNGIDCYTMILLIIDHFLACCNILQFSPCKLWRSRTTSIWLCFRRECNRLKAMSLDLVKALENRKKILAAEISVGVGGVCGRGYIHTSDLNIHTYLDRPPPPTTTTTPNVFFYRWRVMPRWRVYLIQRRRNEETPRRRREKFLGASASRGHFSFI